MPTDRVGKDMSRKNSDVIKRQGHTKSVFGSDPGISPKNGAQRPVQEVRP